MAFNKRPLALRYDDTTGNADGLIEFKISESDDISGIHVSSLSGMNIGGISTGDSLVFSGGQVYFSSIQSGGGGGGTVNLGVTADASQVEITNTAGTNAVIAAADSSDAGLFLPAEKTKLTGIETGATADQTASDIKTLLGASESSKLTASEIADDAIGTDQIADDAVTADKLANSINTDIATGVTANTTANAALPKGGGEMSGNITMAGSQTVDGRDLSADGSKLDGIETNADVTDAVNVKAAGAVMFQSSPGTATNNDVLTTDASTSAVAFLSSGTFFDAGIQAKSIATETFVGSVSNALLPSGVVSTDQIYYRTSTGVGGIASTAAGRAWVGKTSTTLGALADVALPEDAEGEIQDGAALIWNNARSSWSATLAVAPQGPLPFTAGSTAISGTVSATDTATFDKSISVTEGVSAANVSAETGSIETAPTTGNHIANKTYVDGINNTQHNRLFAVGTKTDSIANTAVYLGWEFDVPNALSVSDSGGVITLGGTGNTEITFGEAGDYMIDCTARCNADNRVELFVKAEYYDATQESPAFATYNRLQNSNYAARDTDQNTGGTTLSLLLSLNQNDKLRFEAEGDSDGTAVLLVNGTFLRIVKLA